MKKYEDVDPFGLDFMENDTEKEKEKEEVKKKNTEKKEKLNSILSILKNKKDKKWDDIQTFLYIYI